MLNFYVKFLFFFLTFSDFNFILPAALTLRFLTTFGKLTAKNTNKFGN